MNSKVITKLACLIGYLLFAGFSAYFTATSLWLNLMKGSDMWTFWLVYVLVMTVSILAGVCLTNAIKEFTDSVRPSRSAFAWNMIGFFVFWAVSFTTNVHYFFVEKHGHTILSQELISAKNYIEDNTSKTNQLINEQKDAAKMAITAQVSTHLEDYKKELDHTVNRHEGFGELCINILNAIEVALAKDSATYNDKNTYVVFDEVKDAGDRGVTDRRRFGSLYTKYATRALEQLNKKIAVIEKYYENKKNQNATLNALLDVICELEDKHLPAVEKDGSIIAYYKYNSIQDARVISKMPREVAEGNAVSQSGAIAEYKVYPSNRMFDTWSVWSDIISGRLANMTIVQWILIALIFDIVSFMLFTLFRK